MKKSEKDVILTAEEAGEYLRVSLPTLYRYMRDGKVPCFKVGNRWRFKRSVLDEWMEQMSEVSAGVAVSTLDAEAVTLQQEEAKVEKDRDKVRVGFDVGLGGIFRGLGSLVELAEKLAEEAPSEIRREGRVGPLGDKGATAVYGFSVKVGGAGRPTVETFGNVRDEAGKGPVVDDVREPMVDVFDEGDLLIVVAEMPGVSDECVSYEVNGDVLTLSGETGDRKYHKELLLPTVVDETRVSHSYRNGVVELKLWKAQKE